MCMAFNGYHALNFRNVYSIALLGVYLKDPLKLHIKENVNLVGVVHILFAGCARLALKTSDKLCCVVLFQIAVHRILEVYPALIVLKLFLN